MSQCKLLTCKDKADEELKPTLRVNLEEPNIAEQIAHHLRGSFKVD